VASDLHFFCGVSMARSGLLCNGEIACFACAVWLFTLVYSKQYTLNMIKRNKERLLYCSIGSLKGLNTMLHVCRPPSFVHILECLSANVVDSVYMAIVLCLHKLTPSVISINDNIIEYPLLSVNYAYVITLVTTMNP
jgi:hypothetical protein